MMSHRTNDRSDEMSWSNVIGMAYGACNTK